MTCACPESPLPRSARPWRALAAGAGAVGFAAALAAVMAHHEMWRDELQAWLLARDTPNWFSLGHAVRYEGHPAGWHAILWPIAQLTWNPLAMQAVHLVIATVTAWLVMRWAPFSAPVRFGLPFSYFLFYEWGAISRNYAIGALLLVAFCAAYAGRWRRVLWAAAALALACHTSVHALILVVALLPGLVVEFLIALRRRTREAHGYRGHAAIGLALVLVAAATAAWQLKPPADTGFAVGWHTHWDANRAQQAAATLPRAYIPVPSAGQGWWGTSRLMGQGLLGDRSLRLDRDHAITFTLSVAALLALAMLRRPGPLVPWVIGTMALNAFFYIKLMGAPRHHGFHFLLLLVVLWMAQCQSPWSAPRPRTDRWLRGFETGARYALLLPLIVVQLWASAVAVRGDRQHTFSSGRQAGLWLREHGYTDLDRYCIAGQVDAMVSATVAYAQLPSVYYLGRNAPGSYVIWDTARQTELRGGELTRELARYRKACARDLLLISSSPLSRYWLPRDMRQIADFTAGHDRVWIYLWPLPPENDPAPAQ